MPKAWDGKVFFAADVMYIFEVMLSKRLKSHAQANISRGLGKRVNVRAPLKYVPLPEDMQAEQAAGGSGQEAAAPKVGLTGWLARIALLLALLLLPLNAFIGWQIYQEYESEQARAAEYAALLYDAPPSAAARLESGPAPAHIPHGMFDWLKKRSDEVLYRLGLAVYAPSAIGSTAGTYGAGRTAGFGENAGTNAFGGTGSIGEAGGAGAIGGADGNGGTGGSDSAGAGGRTVGIGSASPAESVGSAGSVGATEVAEGKGSGRGSRRLDVVLAAALREIFPALDSNAYFMLWEGGKVLCAPLAPEAEGLDLSLLRDSSGERFVPGFIRKAGQGGGYMFFSIEQGPLGSRYDARTSGKLDRKKGSGSSEPDAAKNAPALNSRQDANTASAERGPGLPDGAKASSGALLEHQADAKNQSIDILAYIAPFEDTDIYLTVWRPVVPDGQMKKNKNFFPGLFRSVYSELFIGLLLIQCSLCGFFGLLRKRS